MKEVALRRGKPHLTSGGKAVMKMQLTGEKTGCLTSGGKAVMKM